MSASRLATTPHPTLARLLSPTQVVEVVFDATPRVLLDERLHEAPGLLPVADLRGHAGIRTRGEGLSV